MTLVSDIIQQAYRESNLIPVGTSPTAAHITEALGRLNTLLLSTVGNEVGDDLTDVSVGGTYDQSSILTSWLPKNVRLLLNLTAAKTYTLSPNPKEGQRFALVDLDGLLATYNVTIDGNGRNIEDAATLVLNTADLVAQWMYRGDTGNWVRIAALASSDQLPFPVEFDDYFITMLALRINPRLSQTLAPETVKALARARSQINSRYSVTKEIESDVTTYGGLADPRSTNRFSDDDFSTGRVYPYL